MKNIFWSPSLSAIGIRWDSVAGLFLISLWQRRSGKLFKIATNEKRRTWANAVGDWRAARLALSEPRCPGEKGTFVLIASPLFCPSLVVLYSNYYLTNGGDQPGKATCTVIHFAFSRFSDRCSVANGSRKWSVSVPKIGLGNFWNSTAPTAADGPTALTRIIIKKKMAAWDGGSHAFLLEKLS